MRRDQLEHAIRTACQIVDRREVIVVGSQAILGTFREDELPAEATMSLEVDILPIADGDDETARLADLIEGVAGEFSTYEEMHGFSIDGVDMETSALAEGWRNRLVRVQNANTAAPTGQPQFTGLVPRQGGPLRGKALRLPGEGPQLRSGTAGCRPRRSGSDRGSAGNSAPVLPARCRTRDGMARAMGLAKRAEVPVYRIAAGPGSCFRRHASRAPGTLRQRQTRSHPDALFVRDVPKLYEDVLSDSKRIINETFYKRFYLDELPDGAQVVVAKDDLNQPFEDIHEAVSCVSGRAA